MAKKAIKEESATITPIDWSKRHDRSMQAIIVDRYYDYTMGIAERVFSTLPTSIDHDALRSAAWDGLLRAIERFDEGHNANFKTYAAIRIRGAMLDSLRNTDQMPRSMRNLQKRRKRAYELLSQRLGRRPTQDEIMAEARITLEQYRLSVVAANSGNSAAYGDNETTANANRLTTVMDTMAAPMQDLDIDQGTFREFLKGIDLDGQTILYLYYYRRSTMATIAAAMSLSESRVSQIHSQLLSQLRERREQFCTK